MASLAPKLSPFLLCSKRREIRWLGAGGEWRDSRGGGSGGVGEGEREVGKMGSGRDEEGWNSTSCERRCLKHVSFPNFAGTR